ncbi:WAP four-disulfide core domain protein 12-like [Monodelphis domestica]|uniref:WAP four-disulfide core domain protein 12-like n=1 Tax=Monodelphis domestica TaxID=13616 RepID=UPI00044318F2|nr:WAP four-disulfide core domain protein 12-like [Monodelphis domestica]XP_016283573.1 WAP four-disulfide core domain protein 12-like [Monodelphis domestica]XP_056667976.1 WAP four-disulfide core domain protein 12-like [Monodelphis domestica]
MKTMKDGICPVDKVHCLKWNVNHCRGDNECKGKLKCCQYNCGFICLDPQTVKEVNDKETGPNECWQQALHPGRLRFPVELQAYLLYSIHSACPAHCA